MQGFIEQLQEWIDTHLNKKIIAIGLVSLLLVSFWLGKVYTQWHDTEGLTLAKPITPVEATTEKTPKTVSSKEIKVHVTGAVAKAGVYSFTTEDRIDDAVRVAGATANADLSQLNLAQRLSDGQKIVVPAYGESPVAPASGNASEGTLVNINTASEKELSTLPGIGETRAKAIIAYREEHGGFQQIEDLKEVSGIGEKSLEKLTPHVTL